MKGRDPVTRRCCVGEDFAAGVGSVCVRGVQGVGVGAICACARKLATVARWCVADSGAVVHGRQGTSREVKRDFHRCVRREEGKLFMA